MILLRPLWNIWWSSFSWLAASAFTFAFVFHLNLNFILKGTLALSEHGYSVSTVSFVLIYIWKQLISIGFYLSFLLMSPTWLLYILITLFFLRNFCMPLFLTIREFIIITVICIYSQYFIHNVLVLNRIFTFLSFHLLYYILLQILTNGFRTCVHWLSFKTRVYCFST